VLKPLSGSGSELVFHCASRRECDKAARLMLDGLAERKKSRMYSNETSWFLAEEYVEGHEFSCDFTIRGDRLNILRLTKKIKHAGKHFGTINGYMMTDWHSAELDQEELSGVLHAGARTLGINEAICMVDFIVCRGKITLLEITPRPGGDCLPFLLRRTDDFDILTFTLDFAQNCVPVDKVPNVTAGSLVALRIHARVGGEIVRIDSSLLRQDSRIREVALIRTAGHCITMPPVDYDSWYLGHILFQPHPDMAIEQQCHELRLLLDLEIIT
jgi:hypothetical protein